MLWRGKDGQGRVNPVRAAADTLRQGRGHVRWGSAKLENTDGEGEHREYFWAKDLIRYVEANPGRLDFALRSKGPADKRTPQDVASELVRAMLKEGLVVRVERKYKRPKPGRTRLVKWPRTVLQMEEQAWDEGSMYAFTYDRPTPIWYYLAIVLLPVVVVGACLFPLAPWWARNALVYFLMGLLCLMLGLTVVRYAIFVAVWITTGHSLWLFPNMMEEQASLIEIFTPVITFQKAKSMKDGLWTRLAALLVCGSVLWLLASHSPDMKDIKEDVRQAHDSIFEYLDKYYGGAKSIEGSTEGSEGQAKSTGVIREARQGARGTLGVGGARRRG